MQPIKIKKASKTDLPNILNLYTHAGFDDQAILDLPSAEEIFERMQRYPRCDVYIAVREGKILGAFTLLIMDNLAHQGAPSGIVEDVVVNSDYRGEGIGKKMMDYAMQECQEAGCYKMCLSSNHKRKEAHRFYEAIGFEQHGYSYLVLFDQRLHV